MSCFVWWCKPGVVYELIKVWIFYMQIIPFFFHAVKDYLIAILSSNIFMPSGKICFMKFTFFQDSGGFQMVSLLKLAEITEEGVKFQSPHDGQEMLLTPEKSTEIQNSIGADIIMQLDDVVSSTTKGAVVLSSSVREAGLTQW